MELNKFISFFQTLVEQFRPLKELSSLPFISDGKIVWFNYSISDEKDKEKIQLHTIYAYGNDTLKEFSALDSIDQFVDKTKHFQEPNLSEEDYYKALYQLYSQLPLEDTEKQFDLINKAEYKPIVYFYETVSKLLKKEIPVKIHKTKLTKKDVEETLKILVEEGISKDKAGAVLRAIGETLLDTDLESLLPRRN